MSGNWQKEREMKVAEGFALRAAGTKLENSYTVVPDASMEGQTVAVSEN
jgi:hypothetical protein